MEPHRSGTGEQEKQKAPWGLWWQHVLDEMSRDSEQHVVVEVPKQTCWSRVSKEAAL